MDFLDTLEQLGLSTWVRESGSLWSYPTILWLHVMGMGVVAGVSGVISLRLLGVAPKTAIQPLERLYPLLWWGFWVNAATGTALLLAAASTKLINPTFYVKMIFLAGGLAVLQLTRNKVFRSLGPDGALPASAKPLAWAGLICWLGVITAGRLLAYLGPGGALYK
jgi:hypothetical protein